MSAQKGTIRGLVNPESGVGEDDVNAFPNDKTPLEFTCEHNDITANSLSACASNLQIELSSLCHKMDSQKCVSVMVKLSHLQLAPCLQYQDQMETELQLVYNYNSYMVMYFYIQLLQQHYLSCLTRTASLWLKSVINF